MGTIPQPDKELVKTYSDRKMGTHFSKEIDQLLFAWVWDIV